MNLNGYVKLIIICLLQGAPHPPSLVMGDTWTKPYSREYAAFPAAWLREAKFWPTTGKILHSFNSTEVTQLLNFKRF